MNEKKERTEKRGIGVMVVDLIIASIIFSLFLLAAFSILLFQEGEEQSFKSFYQKIKGEHIVAIIIIYLGFFAWQIYSVIFELERDEKWEKQSQTDIKKATENLKKDLLETKTELLLTQNKLREEQEKNRKENLEKGN
jgi:hypothetical protein